MAVRKPIFVVPIPLVGLEADSEGDGHPVDHLARFDAIGLTWESSNTGDHWVRGQIASSQVDFCAVIAANAIEATQIRLRLGTSQAEVDGTAPYDSTELDFISTAPSPTPANGLYHSHLEIDDDPPTATWFRIDIVDHVGEFEAAAIVLGQKIEPSRFYNWDYEYGVEDLGEGAFTPWGVFDEDPGVVLRTLDFTLAWQTQDEFEDSFRPMIEALGTRGFVYLCFDPEETTRRHAKTYLGVLKKPGFARGTRKPGFTQDYSIISTI